MMRRLGLESEPCSGNWSLVKALDNFDLDRKIHAAGWNFFFMGAEVKVMFFGAPGEKKIQNALKRILRKVQQHHFHGLEITEIVGQALSGRDRFCALSPYATELLSGQHRSTPDVPEQRGMRPEVEVRG